MAHRINWAEIPVMDLDRAVGFYGRVLDCEVGVHREEKFAVLAYEKGEVSGALVRCDEHRPSSNGVLIHLNVEGRLDEAAERTRDGGGTVLEGPCDLGPYGRRYIIVDSECNRVALHSYTGE